MRSNAIVLHRQFLPGSVVRVLSIKHVVANYAAQTSGGAHDFDLDDINLVAS